MVNHLEQLIAEWYEFQGFFVRRNIRVDKLPTGGYACELDVVAYHPGKRKLVHIESSLDADSWAKREVRFRKKFAAGRQHIPELFHGIDLPDESEQIAVLAFASKKNHQELAGGKLVLVQELLAEVAQDLAERRIAQNAIPEQFGLLRTIQFITEHRKDIWPD
jgi:hypothetical protein